MRCCAKSIGTAKIVSASGVFATAGGPRSGPWEDSVWGPKARTCESRAVGHINDAVGPSECSPEAALHAGLTRGPEPDVRD